MTIPGVAVYYLSSSKMVALFPAAVFLLMLFVWLHAVPVEGFYATSTLSRLSIETRSTGHYKRTTTVGLLLAEIFKDPHQTNRMGYNAYIHRKRQKVQRQTLLGLILSKWRQIQQCCRQLIHRTTVYVLKCEHDKYYVGSTKHWKKRWREHFENPKGGSKWTRIYRPVAVEAKFRRVPERFLLGVEAQVTAEYMLKFGVNNVRGAYFTHPRTYTLDDISILTSFLGHYGQLDFKKLEKQLQTVLPRPSSASSRRSRSKNRHDLPLMGNNLIESRTTASRRDGNFRNTRSKKKDVCFNCGKIGHWAYECPDMGTSKYPKNNGSCLSDESFLQSILNDSREAERSNNGPQDDIS